MSEGAADATEGAEKDEGVVLPPSGDAAFGALMDVLAAEEDAPKAGEGGAPASTDAGDGGSAAAAPEGTGAAKPDAGASTEGAPGEPAVPADGAAGDATATAGEPADRPADWTKEPTELKQELGDLSNKFQETVSQSFKDDALAEVRKDFSKHFEAIEKHPRMLVGASVPSLTKDGEEVLKDSQDAKEWQEAVKQLLFEEVTARAQKAIDENSALFETAHASIELFQNNPDLTPGSKTFDKELADAFVKLAEPYELRVEGKLHGWSIPVQGLINNLRADLTARRTAKPEEKKDDPEAKPEEKIDPPQAGITSKAGASADDTSDFSTLFGTLGKDYENIRI